MKTIITKPIESKPIIVWGDDENKEHILDKGENCQGTVIYFDKRQKWEVCPYRFNGKWWGACAYKNLYVRLGEKDLKSIFGEDIIERAELKGENNEKTNN